MADARTTARVKEAFKSCDASGNGKLCFAEFFALLKRGNPRFREAHAKALFEVADHDRSGEVDFEEFVEYIFNDAAMEVLFRLESNSEEEEAKHVLLSKPSEIRNAAAKAVKQRGLKWRNLSWKERLEEVRHLEKAEAEHSEVRSQAAPAFDPTGTLSPDRPMTWGRRASAPAVEVRPVSPTLERTQTRRDSRAAVRQRASVAVPQSHPQTLAPHRFAIADMSQQEIVNYSLQEDDLSFAGNDASVKQKLRSFRDYLKTADSPLRALDVEHFIAKGSAGWVFMATCKESGSQVAMKLVRMTQARSGIKEWYVSKILRDAQISNIVFTDERVHVVSRSDAPKVIVEQIQNAGPVNYYMCLIQQLMPWGTLEDLAKDGELAPDVMLKTLHDVAATLATMHEHHVQHRDVKPENIMLVMDDDDVVTAAKLCDFGSAMVGDDPASRSDDIRRFGVTLFSVATGEGWTSNRLIHANHDDLVARLAAAVDGCGCPTLQRLPAALREILSMKLQMAEVSELMAELSSAYLAGPAYVPPSG